MNQQHQFFTSQWHWLPFVTLMTLIVGCNSQPDCRALLPAELPSNPAVLPTIAHAAGGWQALTYTNSVEALNSNYAKGFRWFELDFEWSSDQQLVCLHDWQVHAQQAFGHTSGKPLPAEAFYKTVKQQAGYTPCSIDQLKDWLLAHPDAVVVTDFKRRTLKGLEQLREQLAPVANQLVAQIYQPKQYKKALALGYQKIIWTLYRYQGNCQQVANAAKEMKLVAVTMPTDRLPSLTNYLMWQQGIPVYVHTINDPEVPKVMENWGISGIYTDFLPPAQLDKES